MLKWFLVFALFMALVFIRAFEDVLFYDPFVEFFQNEYLYSSIPEFEYDRLILDLFFRYCMNSVISLGIIYLVFEKLGYVILSAKLYVLGFVLLISAYAVLLSSNFENGYLLPFYIRRFLIHPLFLLLLMAALLYEKLVGVKPTL